MAVQTLVIDHFWPTLLNVLMRANKYRRQKLLYVDADVIGAEAIRQGITRATGRRDQTVRRRVSLLIRYGKGDTAPDPDALWKSLLDALVRNRLLVDDSRHWIELGPVTYEQASRRGLVVTLEDLGDTPP